MKKICAIGMLFMFVYVAFRPPTGMRKFPVANIQFEVQGQNMSMSTAPGQ